MSSKIPVSEADRLLQSHVHPAPSVRCPLEKAAGRVLREEVRADRDLPPFDRCMLDGYAVRAAEAEPGAIFTIAARIHAGEDTAPLPAPRLSALEIMTGSSLPPGADAVIPYESTTSLGDNQFRFEESAPLSPEDGVHRQASDYPKGTPLLSAGSLLGPVEVGIAASCGYAEPLCSQLPRIAIFGTGDELVPVQASPGPTQIRRSNLYVIENALASAGFPAGLVSHLSDDIRTQEQILACAIAENDLVIISGAVSRGKRDRIPEALDQQGQRIFHGVSQRPGKPMGFWTKRNRTAIFGLPGNPVSTLIATHRYVIPFLLACAGAANPSRPTVETTDTVPPHPDLTRFLPFQFTPEGKARLQPTNNSGDYARLANSAGFLEIPAQSGNTAPLTSFSYQLWQR
ncbi:molybdopterin molybdotransferase MoeA [Puniceicoccus vermicola]|uniref:Molybdopterin molybdenumtransferase n=1 Tax=Puniceicoccus vermicola TaxID=388746 RepID=A0A7X1E6A3_9BACT|nr:molybdopterin molybdotransferase MoeA [Puniceicoccus vermicola]MBC2603936.1 molybdopterin molybdotransferase MoeA [Puniceicoccus vermicola]